MKKKMFMELSPEEMEKVLQKNEKLLDKLFEAAYENQMDMQGEEYDNLNISKYVRYHDNYSSFYLTIQDYKNFIWNIDEAYISPEDVAKIEEAKKLIDEVVELDYQCEIEEEEEKYRAIAKEADEKTEKYETLADEVLENIEKYLHSFEDYPALDDIIEAIDCYEYIVEDVYVDMETLEAFKDIAYTEKYC